MGIILPKTDVMLSSVNEVAELCAPLKNYGITFFSHTKVYPDGGFVDISNSASMIDYFYYKTDVYKHYDPDMRPECFENGFFLCSTLKENKAVIACKEDLNIDNLIVFAEKAGDNYDIWNFGTERNNDQIINFYLNNLDLLKSFTLFFRERGQKLIKEFEKDRIIRPIDKIEDVKEGHKQDSSTICSIIKDEAILSNNTILSPELKKYYLGGKYGDTYLTPTEFKVLCWCVTGKSADEISVILHSKRRTVEEHIEHIKMKFHCLSKLSLIKCVYEDTYLRNFINAFIKHESQNQ